MKDRCQVIQVTGAVGVTGHINLSAAKVRGRVGSFVVKTEPRKIRFYCPS